MLQSLGHLLEARAGRVKGRRQHGQNDLSTLKLLEVLGCVERMGRAGGPDENENLRVVIY